MSQDFVVYAAYDHDGYKQDQVIGKYSSFEEAQTVAEAGPFNNYRYIACKVKMAYWYDQFLNKVTASITDEQVDEIAKELTDYCESNNAHPSELEKGKQLLKNKLFHVRFIEPME